VAFASTVDLEGARVDVQSLRGAPEVKLLGNGDE
jgi:hypothetical protein